MATSSFAAPLGGPRFRAFAGGVPLNGGKVYVYVAGNSTLDTSYPTYNDALAGTNAQANPVILDSNGEATIFLQAGRLYKILVQDSNGVQQWVIDDVNPAAAYPATDIGSPPFITEWVQDRLAMSPQYGISFVSATSFRITGGDFTAYYGVGRRVKSYNSAGYIYSTVISCVYSGGNTTVTVVNDSGALDSGFSVLYYGLLPYSPSAYLDPMSSFTAIKQSTQTGFAAATVVTGWNSQLDSNSEWDSANNRWVCKYPGNYEVMAQALVADTASSVQITLGILKNGTGVASNGGYSHVTPNNQTTQVCHYVGALVAGDTLQMNLLGTSNTSVVAGIATRFSVLRKR